MMGDTQFQSETQLFEGTFFAGETNVEPISPSSPKTVPDTFLCLVLVDVTEDRAAGS